MTMFKAQIVSLVIVLISGPILIPILKRLKFGQYIRLEGPQKHMVKAGTPTMGGLMFLLSTATATLIFLSGFNDAKETLLVLVITLAFGFLGFLDDFIKVVLKRPLGLKAREKLVGQFLLAFFLVYFALNFGRGTGVLVPYLGIVIQLSPWLYMTLAAFFIVFFSNAVNLTDGLDGLASGTTLISALALVLIAYIAGKIGIMVFIGALAAGLLGFLFYNRYPAKVFMGDTGSLALGGGLAAVAVMTRTELYLLLIGGIFVVEAFSVIIQVASFKLTGKRVFRMSPIHHHYELKGWSEKKVVLIFWFWAVIFGMLGLLGLPKII